MASSVGGLPKLPDLTPVLFLLLALPRILSVHPMIADHNATSMGRNDVGRMSPTPVIWTNDTRTMDSETTRTSRPIAGASIPIYGLGAQPRMYASREHSDHHSAVSISPSPVAVVADHESQSKMAPFLRDGRYSSDTVRKDRTSPTWTVDPVKNWASVTATPLVTDGAVSDGGPVSSVVEKNRSSVTVSPVPVDSSSSSVLWSVEPTALPDAKVDAIRVMGTPSLAVESSLRSLELQRTVATTPLWTTSQRFPASTVSAADVASLWSSSVQPPALRVTATNGTEPISTKGSTVRDNQTISSPVYADVQSVDDDDGDGSGTDNPDRALSTNLTIAPTSSSNFTAFNEQTNAKVLMMSTAADVGVGQPASESQVQAEAPLPAGTVAGIVVASIGFIGILATGLGLYMIKRLRGLNTKTYNGKFSGDSCSYLDSLQVSYINSHMELPKESSEEMFSLDNDSFLNSLEAMTMENYWAEDRRSTKV